MYQSLYQYAISNDLQSIKNRVSKPISAYVLVGEDAESANFDKCIKGYKSVCPDTGTLHATTTGSSFLCDKFGVIFPSSDSDEKYKRKHKTYMDYLERASHIEIVNKLYKFVLEANSNPELLEEICGKAKNNGITEKDNISFIVDKKKIEKDTSWCEWFDAEMDRTKHKDSNNDIERISCITGDQIHPIIDGVFPMIKTSQTGTGAYVASFKYDAYTSYGLRIGMNSPMSAEEAEAIKTALEHLLTSKTNHSNDYELIFWHDKTINDQEDLLLAGINPKFFISDDNEEDTDKAGEGEKKEYEKILHEMLNAYKRNSELARGQNSYFHMLEYRVPTKGRLLVSNEQSIEYFDLYNNLRKWYEDSCLKYPYSVDHSIYNIYGILYGLIYKQNTKNKYEQVKNEFGSDIQNLLYAMLFNKPIPRLVFIHAMKCFLRSVINGRFSQNEEKNNEKENPTRIALSVIKAYLTRKGSEYSKVLDKKNTNKGYLCGRYLAVLGRLQESSLHYSNKSVSTLVDQKYYKSARQNPARTFGQCAKNNGIYLKRLPNYSKYDFVNIMSEISEKLNGEFPSILTFDEQGAFDLGYAQQYQDIRLSQKKKDTDNK